MPVMKFVLVVFSYLEPAGELRNFGFDYSIRTSRAVLRHETAGSVVAVGMITDQRKWS
jgi:hypothetical protein